MQNERNAARNFHFRSESNSLKYVSELASDILISSGGALVRYQDEYIYKAEFTVEETNHIISTARRICGEDCKLTIDTVRAYYWNYKVDPKKTNENWGGSVYTDSHNFSECALKMCVQTSDYAIAEQMKGVCDCEQVSESEVINSDRPFRLLEG